MRELLDERQSKAFDAMDSRMKPSAPHVLLLAILARDVIQRVQVAFDFLELAVEIAAQMEFLCLCLLESTLHEGTHVFEAGIAIDGGEDQARKEDHA